MLVLPSKLASARRKVLVLCAASSLAVGAVAIACSDDPATPSPTSPESGVIGETSVPGDTSTPTDSAVPQIDAAGVPLLLNEVSPAGEWVELVSTSATGTDIGGYVVADTSKDGGGPKLGESLKFPPGTILPPKAYVIVQGGGFDGGPRSCPDGGQSFCFNAEFGISNKGGETIFLLEPGGAIVGQVQYPAASVDAGETWGRLPSGDPAGVFQVTDKTAGALNRKP